MNEDRARAQKSPARRAISVILALATVGVLTACGAVIDTTMTVANDGSGSRVMVATLSGEDLATLSNGSAAIDASIQKNLPAELTYSGITPTADGGVTVTLTLAFTSSDDYKKKAQALLSKGGNVEAALDFSVTDSLLLKGIRIDEDFTSSDLLKWLFDGLIADGVVAEADASNMYELGSSVLNYGGASVTQNGSYDYTTVVDNGFAGISMATDIADPDKITRTITYSVAPAKYAANKALYDEFFATSTPSGADLTEEEDGTWAMTFNGDAKAISKHTDTATGGTGSELSVKTASAADDPATLTTTVTDVASCESICASGAAVQDTVTGGAGYTPEAIEVDTSASEPVVFENVPAVTSADTKVEFGMFGAVTGTVTFVVPNKSVALVGDGFATLFTPAKGVGSFTSDKGKNDTTFTTVIKGDDVVTFAAAFTQYVPGSLISAVEHDGSGLFGREMSYVINPRLSAILNRHAVTGAITTSVALPLGQSVSSAPGEFTAKNGITGTTLAFTGADAQAAFVAGGPTFAGLLGIALLVMGFVALAFLLVRHRHRVLSTVKGARARFQEGMDAPGLASLATGPVQLAGSGRVAGSVFGVAATPAYAGGNRSLVDVPHHPLSPNPAASLFGLPRADKHPRKTGVSLFTLPHSKVAGQIRGTLFAHDDALGNSRPRNNTN